jgi:hypothetical protein
MSREEPDMAAEGTPAHEVSEGTPAPAPAVGTPAEDYLPGWSDVERESTSQGDASEASAEQAPAPAEDAPSS